MEGRLGPSARWTDAYARQVLAEVYDVILEDERSTSTAAAARQRESDRLKLRSVAERGTARPRLPAVLAGGSTSSDGAAECPPVNMSGLLARIRAEAPELFRQDERERFLQRMARGKEAARGRRARVEETR